MSIEFFLLFFLSNSTGLSHFLLSCMCQHKKESIKFATLANILTSKGLTLQILRSFRCFAAFSFYYQTKLTVRNSLRWKPGQILKKEHRYRNINSFIIYSWFFSNFKKAEIKSFPKKKHSNKQDFFKLLKVPSFLCFSWQLLSKLCSQTKFSQGENFPNPSPRPTLCHRS